MDEGMVTTVPEIALSLPSVYGRETMTTAPFVIPRGITICRAAVIVSPTATFKFAVSMRDVVIRPRAKVTVGAAT